MKVYLNGEKNQYKANLHCHTVFSDGKLTPEEIKESYLKRGYSAVAFTDHEHIIDQSHLTDEGFVAITGCELAIKEFPEGSTLTHPHMKATHLCLYSKDPHNTLTPCYNSVYDHFITPPAEGKVRGDGEYERRYGAEGINEMVKRIKEQGFLVCYNHPTWSLEDATDYLGYEGLDFVEILNTGALIDGLNDDEAVFAQMLRHGKKIFCTGADDNHNRARPDSPLYDSFGAHVMILADSLTYESLISALEKGDFYTSEEPEIYSVFSEGDAVTVKCSPAEKITVLSLGRRSKTVYAENGKPLTEVTVRLAAPDGFRIRVEDKAGKRAFTQFFRP